MEKRNASDRVSRWLDWADHAKNWLGPLVGTLSFSSIAAWAASATDWLTKYGPIAWVGAGFAGALVFALLYVGWAWARHRIAVRRFYLTPSELPAAQNPLESVFTRQRINLADFADPGTREIRGKTFVNCDLVGPESVLFSGCNFTGMRPVFCDFVVLRDDRQGNLGPVHNLIRMMDCTLQECSYFRLVMFMPKSTADFLDKHSKGGVINWLTRS